MGGSLSNVAVCVLLSLHTLQVLLLDEDVDALLNNRNFRLEAGRKLVENFGHELRVVESLSHLHDTDDSCLNEHLAIFFNVFVCYFLLCLLFRLQREVDVDAKFLAEMS